MYCFKSVCCFALFEDRINKMAEQRSGPACCQPVFFSSHNISATTYSDSCFFHPSAPAGAGAGSGRSARSRQRVSHTGRASDSQGPPIAAAAAAAAAATPVTMRRDDDDTVADMDDADDAMLPVLPGTWAREGGGDTQDLGMLRRLSDREEQQQQQQDTRRKSLRRGKVEFRLPPSVAVSGHTIISSNSNAYAQQASPLLATGGEAGEGASMSVPPLDDRAELFCVPIGDTYNDPHYHAYPSASASDRRF